MNHLTCHTLNSRSIDVAALDALPQRPFPVWLSLHLFDPKKPPIRLLKMALERHERDSSLVSRLNITPFDNSICSHLNPAPARTCALILSSMRLGGIMISVYGFVWLSSWEGKAKHASTRKRSQRGETHWTLTSCECHSRLYAWNQRKNVKILAGNIWHEKECLL